MSRLFIYFIVLSIFWLQVEAFIAKSKLNTKILLNLAGRSPAEAGISKKALFKQLRDKFNEASKAPGFFSSELEEEPVRRFLLFD